MFLNQLTCEPKKLIAEDLKEKIVTDDPNTTKC